MDLNADLGEGFGRWPLTDDDALLAVVTSANVACGFHAGDATTMRRVCEGAVRHGVTVGAQVSYRDLAGFGRREMSVPRAELAAELGYQAGALEFFARAAGTEVRYLKPHGALYNRAVWDEEQAGAVIDAVRLFEQAWGRLLPVLALPGSALLAAAEAAGVPAVPEAFADRRYTPGGTLVPRTQPGAVLPDADAVLAQAVGLAVDGAVTAQDGTRVAVTAASLCLHGDTPGAAALAARVRDALGTSGVVIAPFA